MMTTIIYLLLFQIVSICANELIEDPIPNNFIKSESTLIESKLRQSRNRASVPQSLTLLMNFKNDGTTSFQIMQGSQVVYVDGGLCKYGQLFDPATGRCRDIYCQELNHKFNGTTCIPDESKNTTNAYKRMSDIDLSTIIVISQTNRDENIGANFSVHLNSRMNESCSNDWAKMFHETLKSYLGIDYERIIKIRFSIQDDKPSNLIIGKTPKKDNNTSMIPLNSSANEYITEQLNKNNSVTLNFHFSIADRNDVSKDTLTGLHVVTLLLLASERHASIHLCQNYSFVVQTLSIVSDRNKTRQEFCDDPDVMFLAKNGEIRRRIKPSGEIDYVVDVPELETTYEGGDFTYLYMVSTVTQQTSDVSSKTPATNSTSSKLVSVCIRQPRIVERCPDSLVMRVALCEVTQYKNHSIRIKRTGRLYTNREYRYDDFRSDLYVVVCKHNTHNGTTDGSKPSFFEKAPGFLSTIAIILSIFALAITLITFLAFSSLRNLPGCNTINLIIALMLAEILFLLQSLLIMTRPSVCLLFALGIHFFFLASFFWMNVMAFDLWKTFHKGFSLYVCEIRERLPYYSLYAWGMPVLIVLIGIILDAKNASLKPCYGRYFRGCYDVCFHTKNDAPLQGCWIESALMRFLLFGVPVAIILIVNFIFYALTVRSIRRGLKSVRVQVERKFQRKKQVVPGEYDVKIYMRMAVLAGFGWTIGFILFALPDSPKGFQHYLVMIFKYLFILLNATPGLFIFVVYVCNRRVVALYRNLFVGFYEFIHLNYQTSKEWILNHCQLYFNQAKYQFSRLFYKSEQQNISMNVTTTQSLPEKQRI
ncbi:hypothetical protein I4U23_018290 [Adineta vaga]|nr:hypothetical protein I4U23_018290 [Adineta vaga]